MIEVLLLILADQIIKVIISSNFMEKEFFFIDNIIGFKPCINDKYSWINSWLNLKIGYLPHIVFNFALLLIMIVIVSFIRERYKENQILNVVILFLLSGSFCSLIDKLFWGGSLDYIWLKGFFVFDLKDVYITIFEIIVVACLVFDYKGIRKFNEREFFSELKSYIKMKFLRG